MKITIINKKNSKMIVMLIMMNLNLKKQKIKY